MRRFDIFILMKREIKIKVRKYNMKSDLTKKNEFNIYKVKNKLLLNNSVRSLY